MFSFIVNIDIKLAFVFADNHNIIGSNNFIIYYIDSLRQLHFYPFIILSTISTFSCSFLNV